MTAERKGASPAEGEAKAGRRVGLTQTVIGFELLAIVAAFIAPAIRESSIQRQATLAAKELQQVSVAATAAYTRTGQWPDGGTPGSIPASLKPLLPPGLAFDRKQYLLNWDHWRLSDGAGQYSETTEYAGVSVIADDARFLSLVTQRLGNKQVHFTVGNRTFVAIAGPGIAAP